MEDPMTEDRLALSELLEKAGDGDFLRTVAEAVLQLLMDADVEGLIGAGRYERSGERTTWRNGHRERVFDTRLGSLQLRIRHRQLGRLGAQQATRPGQLAEIGQLG
jgi:putative transposase